MNIQHHEVGFKLTDEERMHMAEKLGHLAHYCKYMMDESTKIFVSSELRDTEKAKDRMKVSITIEFHDHTERADSRREMLLASFDRCIEKLEPQVKRYKDKHSH